MRVTPRRFIIAALWIVAVCATILGTAWIQNHLWFTGLAAYCVVLASGGFIILLHHQRD